MAGKLTAKQQAFVREYLVDLNATQAAIRAGYSARTARAQGNRLLTNADVAAAVKAAQLERAQRTELTQDYVLDGLRGIAENPAEPAAPRVKAFELLGKHQGMFTDRVDHTSGGKPLGAVAINVYLPDNEREVEGAEA